MTRFKFSWPFKSKRGVTEAPLPSEEGLLDRATAHRAALLRTLLEDQAAQVQELGQRHRQQLREAEVAQLSVLDQVRQATEELLTRRQALTEELAHLDSAHRITLQRRDADFQVEDAALQARLDTARIALEQKEGVLRVKQASLEAQQVELDQLQEQVATRRKAWIQEAQTPLPGPSGSVSMPDTWTSAFALAADKVWDLLLPIVKQTQGRSEQVLYDHAVSSTLAGLESVLQRRLEAAGQAHLQPIAALQAKQQEFRQRRDQAPTEAERLKFEHYLTALDWALEATPHGD